MISRKTLNTPQFRFAWSLICIVATVSTVAQQRAPVEVAADRAEYDEATQTVTYRGNVVVTQADTLIKSSSLIVHEVNQSDSGGQLIVAEGNPVTFRHLSTKDGKETTGQSNRAEYNVDKELLTLIGDAVLVQEGNRVTSDRIVYNIKTQIAKGGASAKGKERVRTVIQPRKK